MQDYYQRNINYLRISVTDFCNFRCQYCMPMEGVKPKKRADLLTFEELYDIVQLFTENGVDKVRITGGEPLIRKDVDRFIERLGGMEAIRDLAMTTNASLLTDKAKFLKKAGLKRVNISLDTLDPEKFFRLTRGHLADARKGFHAALDAGLGVKINTVLLKGINDMEIEDLIALTKKYPVDVRFIEVMPIGSTADYSKERFLSTEEVLKRVPLNSVLKEDPCSPAKMYQLEGAMGKVGLIRPLSNHFCNSCNRIRLTADGKLKPCLHSDLKIDIKTPLRAGEDIRPYIEQAIGKKPKRHYLLEGQQTSTCMNTIGG